VIEPLTLLTALALVTEHVGLIATASTSYNSPYNLARRFSGLDHVSNGRAGWNIVTTAGIEAARNFGVDEQPLHADRYARAAEFLDVTLKLWDSWEDDVFVGDKAAGVWGDSAKIHPADHEGQYFSVAGALNSPRSPQAYPLLVQAGSSDDGKDFAARYAEAVFTAQQTLATPRRSTATSRREPTARAGTRTASRFFRHCADLGQYRERGERARSRTRRSHCSRTRTSHVGATSARADRPTGAR